MPRPTVSEFANEKPKNVYVSQFLQGNIFIPRQCSEMNVCIPQNLYVDTLTPNAMVFGDRAFGR